MSIGPSGTKCSDILANTVISQNTGLRPGSAVPRSLIRKIIGSICALRVLLGLACEVIIGFNLWTGHSILTPVATLLLLKDALEFCRLVSPLLRVELFLSSAGLI